MAGEAWCMNTMKAIYFFISFFLNYIFWFHFLYFFYFINRWISFLFNNFIYDRAIFSLIFDFSLIFIFPLIFIFLFFKIYFSLIFLFFLIFIYSLIHFFSSDLDSCHSSSFFLRISVFKKVIQKYIKTIFFRI